MPAMSTLPETSSAAASSSSSPPPHPASASANTAASRARACNLRILISATSLSCLVTVVDAEARLGVEEVQVSGVDRDLRGLVLADARARPQAAHDPRLCAPGARLQLLTRSPALDVGGQLADVLGERLPGLDGDVREHLGSERLAQFHATAQAAVGGHVRC